MRKRKRKLRLNRVFGVILSVCMIVGDVSISLTQSWANPDEGGNTTTISDSTGSGTTSETETTPAETDTDTTTKVTDGSTDSTTTAGTINNEEKTTTEEPTDDKKTKDETGSQGSVEKTDLDEQENPSSPSEEGKEEQPQDTIPVAGVLDESIDEAEVNAAFGEGSATYKKSDEGVNKITLNKNVTLAQTVQIAVNVSVDLAGYTVTAPAGSDVFDITADGLTIVFKSTAEGAQINGGDGVDGTAGASGTAGGAGINADAHPVTLTIGENVTVKGGNGGSSKEVNSEGKGLGNGGRGGDGVIINASESKLTIDGTIIGGDGGNGYTGWEANEGGDGGNGVTLAEGANVYVSGEDGAAVQADSETSSGATVTGGNGGLAGNGGTYGKGGKAFSTTIGNTLSSITQNDGKDGYVLVASGNTHYGSDSEDAYNVSVDMSDVVAELLEKYDDEVRKPGNTVKIDFDVKKVTGEPDKELASEKLNTIDATTLGAYFDISLSLSVTNSSGITTDKYTIGETNKTVTITLAVPDNLQGGTNYSIIRVHKYTSTNQTTTTVLPTQVSDDGKTVTFTTDRFSTYILAYTPATSGGSGNGNGDGDGNGDGNGNGGNGNGSGSGSGSEGGSGSGSEGGSGSGSEGGSGSGSEGGSEGGSGSGSGSGSGAGSSTTGSSSGTAVSTTNGGGTGSASNTAYVSTSSTSASNGKDAEPKTGDMRQNKALIFVHLGTAAACLYLIAIAVEAKLNRRRKRA